MEYFSSVKHESKTTPGVSFTITRMSFGRRIELTRRIRDLARRIEFLEAGSDFRERIEATVLEKEIERVYLEWGLKEVGGLVIDGREAGPLELIEDGPEELCQEIVGAIKAECGLSEEERKN